MATTSTYKLRSFTINGTDLSFLLSQVTFKPLFDKNGVPIVNWKGNTAIYDINGNKLYDPTDLAFNNAQGLSAINGVTAALAYFGTSYDSVTDASGLRNVSGLMNNLIKGQSHWGQADTPFIRLVKADFNSYTKTYAPTDAGASYGKNFDGTKVAYDASGNSATPGLRSMKTDYSTTPGANGSVVQKDVVDYTPRMISLLTTTAGVTYEKDSHGKITFTNGLAQVKDWGMLSVDNGGQIDYQNRDGVTAKLDAYGHLVKTNGVVQTINNHDANGNISNPEQFVGSINPGVSPNNGWFALFGQFFDHGLDFVAKGGQGTKIKIALSPTDPLYVAPSALDPGVTSMTISRATVAGFDAKGDPYYTNHDSPYIDQSQTYGSNSQITNFLREWVSTDGGNSYHAGTNLFNGKTSVEWIKSDGSPTTETLPTINELRKQLLETHRTDLSWDDISNFRNRDASGNVQAGAGTSGAALLLDMNPHFDVSVAQNSAGHISQSLLDLINAQAIIDKLSITTGGKYDGSKILAADTTTGNIPLYPVNGPSLYDFIDFTTFNPLSTLSSSMKALIGELLLESVGDHYVAGDGRVNENIGLTAIHHVWHEEHNYQVANLQASIAAQDAAATLKGDSSHTILHNWQINTGTQDGQGNYLWSTGGISWDPDKIFNAAKLINEMEYQHVAVDQYARSVTPNLPEFVGYNSNIDASISDEFGQVAFRFGHTTIRETIDTLDPTGGLTGKIMSLTLKDSFLNPSLFASVGAGAIALGMTHQQMNAVDEFVTPALNQGLLGQPLDLAAINIARGRDMGMATLNEMRDALGKAGKQHFAAYANWSEFESNMAHKDNLVNFIAAYSYDGDLERATALFNLYKGKATDADKTYLTAHNYTYADASNMMLNDKGIDHVDAWLGGLAERCVLGGLLGETFDAIFLDQIERLMDGDRFYYLYRLVGQQMGDQVGNEQFKDIVERNTGVTHLNGNVFAYADQYYDMSASASTSLKQGIEHKYADALALYKTGIYTDGSDSMDTAASMNGTLQTRITTINGVINSKQYVYDLRPEIVQLDKQGNVIHETNLDGTPTTGADSAEVLVATAYNDVIFMRGGDDTAYGDGGNDYIDGGDGMDKLYGGTGNDTIFGGEGPDVIDGGDGNDLIYGQGSGTAMNGSDQLIGGSGNDTIYGGDGIDKLSGESGDDVIYGGADTDPFTHGGDGNDFIDGGSSGDLLYGDNGDDIVVGGSDQDVLEGDNGDDILRPGAPSAAMIAAGSDEVLGGDGVTDAGFDIMDLSDWALSPTGVTADFATQTAPQLTIKGGNNFPAWFQIEGLVATANNDTIIGDANSNWLIGGSGNDTITGGAGNDVIIGNSIRLDTLDGTYQVGTTNAAYSFSIDGATNRAGSPTVAATLASNGLLDNSKLMDANGVALFDKHFKDMLSTELFKNTVLGDDMSQVGGSGTGKNMAVYSGAFKDYTFTKVNFPSQNEGTITAYKVTDTTGADGTDLVVGIDYFQFSDGVYTAAGTKITPVVMQAPAPSGGLLQTGSNPVVLPTAGVSTNENSTSTIISLVASGLKGDQFAVSLDTLQYDSDLFKISQDTLTGNWNLSFKAGASYEGSHAPTYTVGLIATDTTLGIQSEQLLTVTLNNIDEQATGAIDVVGYSGASNSSVTLKAANLVLDPDLVSATNATGAVTASSGVTSYQWERSANGTTGWSSSLLNSNKSASYSATSSGYYRVSTTYTDPGTSPVTQKTIVSSEIVYVGSSGVDKTAAPVIAPGTQVFMLGLGGNDNLTGTTGNDTLDGGTGTDILIGGSGNDTYYVENGTNNTFDTVTELQGGGIDTVIANFTTGAYTLGSDVENLTLAGSSNISGTGNELGNIIIGNSGSNTLSGGAGNDTLDGGSGGTDSLVGGTGNDTYIVSSLSTAIKEDAPNIVSGVDLNGVDTVIANLTAGTYTLGSNLENLTLGGVANINGVGNTVANMIVGNDGSNSLSGDAGNDTLNGGNGTDTLIGGTGDDTYIVDSTTDTIIEASGLSNGISNGIDTIQSSVTFTLTNVANVENLTLTGNGNINGTGNSLNNTITGNDGNNSLNGGDGADILIGGAGNDTYIVDSTTDTIVEASGPSGGFDTVVSSVNNYTLGENLEGLTLAEPSLFGLLLPGSVVTYAVNGTGNSLGNLIYGNSWNNSLNGLDGNDTLNGLDGSDTLIGGAGDDTYIVDSTTDTIIEASGPSGGFDTVQSSITYSLTTVSNVENLTLTGNNNINGTGNSGDNIITGNSGYNSLIGGAGKDTLISGGGDDTLDGGDGDDTYIVDSISPSKLFDTSGIDTIVSSLSFSLKDFVAIENLTLTGSAIAGTGNDGKNLIIGNSSDNVLDGGVDADTMIGGAGNDIYYVDNLGDIVTETLGAGGGTDTVKSSINYTLGANLENLTLTTGAGNINGTGNALDNIIIGNSGDNILDGGAGIDTVSYASVTSAINVNLGAGSVTGAGGSDTLRNIEIVIAGSGNDTLTGASGASTLIGGLGDDTYNVTNSATIVTEATGGGTDTVRSSVSYTLGANLENLTLTTPVTGSSNFNGTGNDLNNIIIGNSGANSLVGGAGNDTLTGGGGADTLVGGLGDDTYYIDNIGQTIVDNQPYLLFFTQNAGTDTVSASISYTLGAYLENLILTGTAANGKGNDLANTITGNSGDNVLDGGTGADNMSGGLGNDTYVVDNINDVVTETTAAGGGTDTVNASVNFTLGTNLENLNLTGAANINGTGNTAANTIVGNSANNILSGGLGNDTLTGGGGADYFVFNTATGPTNVDTITDFTQGTDFLQFSKAVFTKVTAASSGVAGTALTSTLVGGDFVSGTNLTTAAKTTEHFIYNITDGSLYYDADGSTATIAAVKVAIIGTTSHPGLAAGDIHIIA